MDVSGFAQQLLYTAGHSSGNCQVVWAVTAPDVPPTSLNY